MSDVIDEQTMPLGWKVNHRRTNTSQLTANLHANANLFKAAPLDQRCAAYENNNNNNRETNCHSE